MVIAGVALVGGGIVEEAVGVFEDESASETGKSPLVSTLEKEPLPPARGGAAGAEGVNIGTKVENGVGRDNGARLEGECDSAFEGPFGDVDRDTVLVAQDDVLLGLIPRGRAELDLSEADSWLI